MILTAFKYPALLSALILLMSCGSVKDDHSGNGQTTVSNKGVDFQGTIMMHKPYCGGAAPTPDQEMGFNEPVRNAEFYLYKDSMPRKRSGFILVKTNEQGIFNVKLVPGKYYIVQKNKLLSLEEFIKVNTVNNQYYTKKPDSCFEKWKNSPDFSFELTGKDEKVFTENHRCFTGANPCINYTGPYPP